MAAVQPVDQFTEYTVTTTSQPCQRLKCGKTVRRGENIFLVTDGEQRQKKVCLDCYNYYHGKFLEATRQRSTYREASAHQVVSQSDTFKNAIQGIRKNVNQSQRQGTYWHLASN